jgi:hypothetical protein
LEPKNPDDPVWSIIRKLADKIGEQLTTLLRDIADENSLLKGIIDRVDFNATTHGVRDLDGLVSLSAASRKYQISASVIDLWRRSNCAIISSRYRESLRATVIGAWINSFAVRGISVNDKRVRRSENTSYSP